MRFICKWSFSLANFLMEELNENHTNRRVYYFSLQVIIGSIVKFIFLFLLAVLSDSVFPALLILLAFSSLRSIAGGYHMDTYGKCIAASTGMFILLSIFTKYTYHYWDSSILYALVLVTFLISFRILYKWAPKDSINKRITSERHRKKFKILSMIYIFIWLILGLILVHINMKMAVLSICEGFFLEAFSITPLGERIFGALNGKLQKIRIKEL